MNIKRKVVILSKDIWIILYLLVFLILYIILLFSGESKLEDIIKKIELIIVVQLGIYFLISFKREGINSFFSKSYNNFLLMLVMFHLGIPITHVLGYSNSYFVQEFYWYYDVKTLSALISVILFVNLFLFSKVFTFNSVNTNYKIENKYLVNINFFILLISSLLWIFIIYFVLGIKEYKEFYSEGGILFNIVFVYLTVVINVSFLLALLASRWVKLALITFLIWSLFAFSLGVRGPALYPFAIGGAILISRKLIKLNYKRLIVGSLAFLSALSYKFLDRGGLDVDRIIDPLAAIQEMGGSLRPVYEVKSWINQGMDFYIGITYLAPFDRQFNSVFKLKENLPSIVDDRLMNVMINNKSGPYGFSLIAEVFINFANFGVIILGFLVGLFFKYLDSRISNNSVTAVLIVFAYGFFYHIRQSFASTFGIVIVGILYVYILIVISRFLNKIQKQGY